MYFHKSLHYLFIVLSYIGFSFSSTLLVWGSILVYYVLLVIRETKYLLFLCCFGTIFKLPFFFSVWQPLFLPWRVCSMSDLLLVGNWVWFHQAMDKSRARCRERSCFQLLSCCFFFFFFPSLVSVEWAWAPITLGTGNLSVCKIWWLNLKACLEGGFLLVILIKLYWYN